MRVCLVSREVSPFFGAGIGTYVAAMLRAWAGAGHETHLVCPAFAGVVEWAATIGARAHTVPVDPIAHSFASESPRHRFMFLAHSAAALEHLEQIRPDYAEFPDYWAEGFAAIAARQSVGALAGTVLGVRLHTPTVMCREINGDAWLDDEIAMLELAESRAIEGADLLLSPTRALLEITQKRSTRPLDGASAVVPYPFFAKSWREQAAPTGETPEPSVQRGVPRPIVLYFGRLEARKGVELLVEAAHRVLESGTDATFRFIGADTRGGTWPVVASQEDAVAGSMLQRLRAMIAPKWATRFEFLPARPRAELGAAIREAARSGGLCCFPSRWENFPNTCLEAMALGTPVLGSNAGGMAEIIDDGNSGFLFKTGDATDLARKLIDALGDRERLRAIGDAGVQRVTELCDPTRVVAATMAAVEQARGGTRATQPPRTPSTVDVLRVDALPCEGTLGARLRNAMLASNAAWIVLAGGDLEPGALQHLTLAATRNPTAAAILPWTEDQGIVRTPVGIDRDLLAIFPCCLGSVWLVRREAALPLIDATVDAGAEWDLLAAIAEAGLDVGVMPRIVARGAASRAAPTDIDAFAAALAVRRPLLPREPGRVIRLMAWQRWRLRQRALEITGWLRSTTAERDAARAEIEHLKAANPRVESAS
ncbi:MAG: glycosyltransferase family 4 protein [Phycisphaerales bacterium]